MELLVYTVPQVTFPYPDPSTTGVSATYSKNGSAPIALSPVADNTNHIATVTLPFQDNEGPVTVAWSFTIAGNMYTREITYDVVTPLLTDQQVRAIIGATATDEEVHSAEASARYIIQGYTGQTFGRYVGHLSG